MRNCASCSNQTDQPVLCSTCLNASITIETLKKFSDDDLKLLIRELPAAVKMNSANENVLEFIDCKLYPESYRLAC